MQSVQQLLQYLDQGMPIEIGIEVEGSERDLLGMVTLFKDESAVVQRLQEFELGHFGISVGLFRNPENPLDSSRTQTFRQIVGHIFWDMIWRPRFAAKNYSKETEAAIQRQLFEDVEGIFFLMFDADQSNSIDVMELVMGLIRVFRSFHSYDNHTSDPIVLVKRKCLSPLFNNLCRATGVDVPNIFIGMFKRMHEWGTLKTFLQSLFTSDNIWPLMQHYSFFQSSTIDALRNCCSEVDPSQLELYDRYCRDTITALSNELFAKLRPYCDTTLQSKLAFFIDDDKIKGLESMFFEAGLPDPRGHVLPIKSEAQVLFLFLWKFMDHFLSKSTSLRHFFNDYHVPVVEDIKSFKIQQLITDLNMTNKETNVSQDSVNLKHWYVSF
jgi:hypothetical protein